MAAYIIDLSSITQLSSDQFEQLCQVNTRNTKQRGQRCIGKINPKTL